MFIANMTLFVVGVVNKLICSPSVLGSHGGAVGVGCRVPRSGFRRELFVGAC